MRIKTTAAAALLILATAPAWAVNKCTGPDGSVVYQERACDGAGKAEPVKVYAGPLTSYELRERDAISKARVACGTKDIPRMPSIGWLEDRFLQCSQIGVLQSPSAVNLTETAGAVSKQYVYRHWGAYVYTRNGVVTTVQMSR